MIVSEPHRSPSTGGNSGKKTITMTFRMDESVMKALRTESESKEISLNTLVNQIFKRFTEWDIYEPKLRMIPVAKPLVSALFSKLSQEEAVEMAQAIGKNVVHDIALFMKGKIDLESFLSWFDTRMKSSSIDTSHSVDNGIHTYIMKHDIGYNWSLYHKTVLESIFNEILKKRVDFMITDTTLSFKFDK